MKKVLLVTMYFPPRRGGISNSLWNCCINLPKDKIVVLTEPSDLEPRSIFKIYRKKLISNSKLIWPKWILLIKHIKSIVDKEKINIIQAGQILPIGTAALILFKLYKIPYHIYVYGQDIMIMRKSKRKMKLIKLILKNAEYVIANSEYTKSATIKLGIPSSKIVTIFPTPIGLIDTSIDQQYFDYFIKRHKLCNKKIVLTVGNIVKRKGQDMMIKALPHIIKKVPNILYIIVGSGEYQKYLEDQIAQSNLQQYVKIYNSISDQELPYFYHACDVFSMPSRELENQYGETVDVEGFGIVYLEANLFGKPAIGGNSGGVPEAIKDNFSGLLVDPSDEKDIAEKCIKLLNDSNLAQQLGQQGRERATQHFQWENEMIKFQKIIND